MSDKLPDSPKRWLWDLHPLDGDKTWGNRKERVPEGTALGATIPSIQYRKERVRRSGTLFGDQGLSSPPSPSYRLVPAASRPAYLPTDDDLAVVLRWHPGDDPHNPAWAQVEAELVPRGNRPDDLAKMNAPTLVRLLAKAIGAPAGPEAPTGSADSFGSSPGGPGNAGQSKAQPARESAPEKSSRAGAQSSILPHENGDETSGKVRTDGAHPPLILGRVRKWAATLTDEIRAKAEGATCPVLYLAASYTVRAFELAQKAAQWTRGGDPPDVSAFVRTFAELHECRSRAKVLLEGQEEGAVWEHWPAAPGTVYCWKADNSALAVAYAFARMIETEIHANCSEGLSLTILTHRAISPSSKLLTFPADVPALVLWRDKAIAGMAEKSLPPVSDWPRWAMHRDRQALLCKLQAEYGEAVKTAQIRMTCAPREGTPILETLEPLPYRDSHPLPQEKMEAMRRLFQGVNSEPNHRKRGYRFEKFLNEFFGAHGLNPRGSFRVDGWQIDGAFEWEGDTYKVEARWRKVKANAGDLAKLRGSTLTSEWTRGLFISMSGFSHKAIQTHSKGERPNLIGMSGDDLKLILEGRWTLIDALRAKLRHTGVTGEIYCPLPEVNSGSANG